MKTLFGLEWIPAFTKWILKFASYGIELPMIISSIYIMLVSGIPDWKNEFWYNSATGLLLASPEILLPGAILRASGMMQRGEVKKAKVTIWIIVAMAGLTALTLACIMIFHLNEKSPFMACVLFLRILASLAYSIITRIDMDGDQVNIPPAQLVVYGPAVPTELLIRQALATQAAQFQAEQDKMLSSLQAVQASSNIDFQALIQAVTDRLIPEFQVGLQAIQAEQFRQNDCLNTLSLQAKRLPELPEKAANSGKFQAEDSGRGVPELRQASGRTQATNTGENVLHLVPANATREQMVAEAKRLQASGISSYQIAERLGKSAKTVQSWLASGKALSTDSGEIEAVN